MKTAILIMCAALSLGICAEDVVATTLFSDGSTNTWTQADLVAALQLINRKYHRDCERGEGRRAWHGRMVREVVSTNGEEIVKTEIHEDGQTFTFPARTRSAAANVAAAKARLKTTMSKGVPTALAEARARREQEKNTVSNVTISVEANTR